MKEMLNYERQVALITEWCKLTIEQMAKHEGDQDEYDGIYQANSDLLERINGSMPWPDLVIERVEGKQ